MHYLLNRLLQNFNAAREAKNNFVDFIKYFFIEEENQPGNRQIINLFIIIKIIDLNAAELNATNSNAIINYFNITDLEQN